MDQFKLLSQFPIKQSTPSSLQQYLTHHNINYTSKQIKGSLHIRIISHGFQIQYCKDYAESGQVSNKNGKIYENMKNNKDNFYRLNSLFLYLSTPKITPYPNTHALPYNLSPKSTIYACIMLLGQPSHKNKIQIQCGWKHLGIDINFNTNNWHDQSATINYICLYDVNNYNCNESDDKKNRLCSVCLKVIGKGKNCKEEEKQRLGCRNCGIIAYCGQKCLEKHYRLHRIYCQEVD